MHTFASLLRQRWSVFSTVLNRRWPRIILAAWALLGSWDLALSQLVPDSYAVQFPKLYQVVATTSGVLSWPMWLAVGALLLATFAVEYAVRQRVKTASPADDGPQALVHNGDLPTFPRAMNVSGVLIQISELRSHQRLHITFTVFNGNAHDVLLTSIYGHVQFITEDGRGTKLYSPTLTNTRSIRVPAHDTLHFTTQIQVPKKLAEVVPDWPEDTSFALEFTELDIKIRSGEGPLREARLPLWDAAVVRRQGDRFTTTMRHYLR